MKFKTLSVLLATAVLSGHAAAVTFRNAQVDVNAVAISNGTPSFDSRTGTAASLPIVAAADSIGTVDLATAGAIGVLGLLTTSSDATGFGADLTNAVATSRLTASLAADDALPYLRLDFSALTFQGGTGASNTSAYLTLRNATTTLFDGYLSGPGLYEFAFAPGATGTVDLLLTSESSTAFPLGGAGNASSFGQIAITSAVPLPAAWILMLTGIGPVFMARRRAGKRPA